VRFLSTRKGGFLSTRKGGFLSTRAGCFVATFARRTRLEYLRVFASNSAESFTQRLVTCRSPCTLMKTLCESFGHSLRHSLRHAKRFIKRIFCRDYFDSTVYTLISFHPPCFHMLA
jgi:hypothetical protein